MKKVVSSPYFLLNWAFLRFLHLHQTDIELIKSIPYFSSLGNQSLEEILQASRKIIYPAQQVVSYKNLPRDAFYIIKQGSIALYMNEKQGNEIELGQISTGDYFGAEALTGIFDTVRDVTAVTTSTTILIRIPYKKIHNNFFIMKCGALASDTESYKYETNNNSYVEVKVKNNQFIQIEARDYDNFKNSVSVICRAILEKKEVNQDQLANFTKSGMIEFAEFLDEEDITICPCMTVNKSSIVSCIKKGSKTLDQIIESTGACTVCCSCQPEILKLLGFNPWRPVQVIDVEFHNKYVVSYKLKLQESAFNEYTPGAHIVLKTMINNQPVQRAYTISDYSQDACLRVTMKLEENGVFTKWLSEQNINELKIEASQPQGNFLLNIDKANTILCIAGGIGITPFMTFAKAVSKKSTAIKMHLVYIARTKDDFIFLNELQNLEQENPNFKLTLWERNNRGYISKSQIVEFIQSLDNPDVYICGPDRLEVAVVDILNTLAYPPEKIKVEKFNI